MLYCDNNIASGDEESVEIILAICGMVPCVVGVVALLILPILILDVSVLLSILLLLNKDTSKDEIVLMLIVISIAYLE